jgi:hypothetical protein
MPSPLWAAQVSLVEMAKLRQGLPERVRAEHGRLSRCDGSWGPWSCSVSWRDTGSVVIALP